MSEPEERTARKAPPSLLKTLLAKGSSAKDALTHDGNNASIILDDKASRETPWTPKSLGRAKTAIVYKQTLNDTLLVLERNMFFISGWVPYFVSLQEDNILMFTSRERWEQGLKPDKVYELHHMMLLGDMKVDVVEGYSSLHDDHGNLRLFHRKLLETDELDEWLNEELHQSLAVSSAGGPSYPSPNGATGLREDHLKRKYSVFLILALAYGVEEEEIREAHERMCLENAAVHAGVGGGSGEQQRTVASFGFEDPESLELYEKYRDAALNYHKMNYGDTAAAEEEDAIMHLPVMLQVAVVRQDLEESSAMLSILNTVKARLMAHCAQENDS
ncbi:Mevalonate kinase [Phytophthora cinnamomi]|uniref:Mevalonate kinase n=1 Tax=Phytophthora cinnamomi TaxID=4785 RepID=UPI00355A8C5C|nr:Mevalonate kinase [Phytophthora cinnamomi]